MNQPVPTATGSWVPRAEVRAVRGTRLWFQFRGESHDVAKLVQVALDRLLQEQPDMEVSTLWVDVFFQAEASESFAEVFLGQGIGKPCWIVTIDRQMKVVEFTRGVGKG